MRILFPITVPPGRIPERRCQETKAFMFGHSADLALAGLDLQTRESGSFKEYEKLMLDFWADARNAGDGYMIVEQDVVPPSVTYLEEMARCPELICVAPVEDHEDPNFSAYRSPGRRWVCSVGTPTCRPGPSMATYVDPKRPNAGTRYIEPGDRICNISGTGIIKFSPKLCRQRIQLGNHFAGLDSRLYGWLANGTGWRGTHVHWRDGDQLVKHNHTFCNGDLANPDVPW